MSVDHNSPLPQNAQAEKTVWKGSPSQASNFLHFFVLSLSAPVLAVLLGLWALVIPAATMAWIWLVTHCTEYELTSQRLKASHGVLNKHLDEIELYRVRDYHLSQPLILRVFGLSNVTLISSDRSHPQFTINAIPNGHPLRERIRALVEQRRRAAMVREIDVGQ